MAYSQLRELARHFAAGRLAREEYQRQRGALLDDMVAGKVQPDYRDIVAPKASTPPVPIIDVGDDEPEVRRIPIILGAVALVAAVGAGGYWYLRLQTAPPPAVVAAAPIAASVTLVRDFVRAGDFSMQANEAFIGAWLALDDSARAAARADKSWSRLSVALRGAIRDQRSMAAADSSGHAAGQAARLQQFAQTIGVKVD
jgi:hypothetical protein